MQPALIALAFILTLTLTLAAAHQIDEIQLPPQAIFAAPNRMTPIPFSPSVSKIFAATTSNPDDQQYIAVNPAKLILSPVVYPHSKLLMLPFHAESMLEELRTFRSADYQDMVILENHVLLFLVPNQIVVVR